MILFPDSSGRTRGAWDVPIHNGGEWFESEKELFGALGSLFRFDSAQARGDKSDIAFENGMDDFKRITKVPALHAYKDGVGHGGTYNQPNGGEFGKVAVAMLQWQFKNDKEAAKMFVGANCGLCQDPQWHLSNKGLK